MTMMMMMMTMMMVIVEYEDGVTQLPALLLMNAN